MINLRDHYNKVAEERHIWFKRHSYYHDDILGYCNFFINSDSSILELGCGMGNLIGRLKPKRGVGVDVSDKMVERAREEFPNIEFICADVEFFESQEKFDYIIISGTLGTVKNIQTFFQRIRRFCTSDTRIIITHYNELWGPIIQLAEKYRLKMPECNFNWLSIDDVENFLSISGYKPIRRDFRLIFPYNIPIISFLFNQILTKVPIIRRLALAQCLVGSLNAPPDHIEDQSVSIILTCRDEEENIEGLVTGIPNIGKRTEIIFVEGHSKDGTVAKIEEMIKNYPQKDIKLYKQKGKGQGDAFHLGCEKAQGDFLCWMEADLTIPPEEIKLFWDAYRLGMGEYINGTRFIYKMEKKAMPFSNFIGNRFFGNVFTMILQQRFTDTLCGYKAISKKNYEKTRKQINFFGDFDPFGDFELIFGAVKNNLKVVEIPVHYRPRNYGQPKAYGKGFVSFLKHALILMKMSWIAFRKFKFF